ncbi:MAG: hypothetical protein HGB21_01150 [Nitrospirae bacterium]|nr:hypothetical protein [Nitrospirota bacterium]NTW64908.1 hypothetical protein [Nitrospirota bacterium]
MRCTLSAVLAVIMMAAGAAYPHGGDGLKGEVSVEVVSDRGTALLTVPHKDFWMGGTRIIKKYLEAKKGENYGIVIRNMTPERIGVVVAVDGRNIISGKRSDLKSTEDMYLVDSYEQARYDGWRTDKDTVHRFYFTDPSDAYSTRTFNDASALGVIAVAVYREKDRPRPRQELKRRDSAPAAPSLGSAEQNKSLAAKGGTAGTGFGVGQYSPTVTIAFEPERTPVQKTLVKYEWREVLCRKGILSCGPEIGNRVWDDGEYAPYPPGHPGN